jgi:RNA polymerase sigma-70 factor (ECF subfamily)
MSELVDEGESGAEERRIEAARRGDLAAFNWLVLRYQTRVYNLCYRMLSDPDEAADATQEAFLSAYRAIGRFKGGQFRAWVLRIASNACLDVLRSRKRRPTQSLDWGAPGPGEEDAEPLPIADLDPSVDPETQALNAELAWAIQEGLNTLPPDQRIALVLVDVQGLSYEEAAEAMKVELGTVKSRLSRARARMRDLLVAAGELPPRSRRLEVGEKNA